MRICETTLEGKFLGVNTGIFNNNPWVSALVLINEPTQDNQSFLKVQKIKIRKEQDIFKSLPFGEDLKLSVRVEVDNKGVTSFVYD